MDSFILDFVRNVLGIKYQDEVNFNYLIFNYKYICIKSYLKTCFRFKCLTIK